MKIVALLISPMNLCLGARCLLNVVGVLHASKYSTAAAAIFTVMFPGFAAASTGFALWGGNPQ